MQATTLTETRSARSGLPTLVTAGEVCEAIGRSRANLYALIERGQFPKPRRLAGRLVWPAEDVRQFILNLPVEE